MKKSESQFDTPADGNCLFWAIMDQTGIDHQMLRKIAVSRISQMISENILFWLETENLCNWIQRMAQDGVHGDSYALQVLRYILLLMFLIKG